MGGQVGVAQHVTIGSGARVSTGREEMQTEDEGAQGSREPRPGPALMVHVHVVQASR